MDNPFEKRATEQITDAPALLPLVSPEPIEAFMLPEGKALFDKLTLWAGTPGAGKTTIARILEFDALYSLARNGWTKNKELAALLAKFGLYEDGPPTMLAYRMPVTTNFRGLWELPYEPRIKESLLKAFVQSKAVLGWLRQLERAGVDLGEVKIEFREGSESANAMLKVDDIQQFRDYARQVELSVFRTVTALMPPTEEEFKKSLANQRYDVFEEIVGIRVNKWPEDVWASSVLRPMVIIDDAHELHPQQFGALCDWLKSRVIGISRWVMCRLDVVAPEDYRNALKEDARAGEEAGAGSTIGRDYNIKLMQMQKRNAKRFRKMATDIADRYFASLPDFARNSVRYMGPAIDQPPQKLSAGNLSELRKEVDQFFADNRIQKRTRESLEERLPASAAEDERVAALRILAHRESRNSPQLNLLAEDEHPPEEEAEEEAQEKGKVAPSLVEGARIQLLHQYKRPFYFGLDKLADASNGNIEQFISLAGPLVNELLAKIIRNKPPIIAALSQHQTLQKQANALMERWDFPYCDSVRALVEWISAKCLERTMLPYAPLDDGANAFGVLQTEMDNVLAKSDRLARVLHFAFAYKALVMTPDYTCKGRLWCLLELGGIPILSKGLTLKHGGFIEGKLSQLEEQLPT